MKKLLIAAALALSACATAPVSSPEPVEQVQVPPVVITAVDSFSKAVDGYTIAARAAALAVNADVLSQDQLKMVQNLNNQAMKLIEGGNTGLTIAQRAASLDLISKQINSILGN